MGWGSCRQADTKDGIFQISENLMVVGTLGLSRLAPAPHSSGCTFSLMCVCVFPPRILDKRKKEIMMYLD